MSTPLPAIRTALTGLVALQYTLTAVLPTPYVCPTIGIPEIISERIPIYKAPIKKPSEVSSIKETVFPLTFDSNNPAATDEIIVIIINLYLDNLIVRRRLLNYNYLRILKKESLKEIVS